MLDLLYFYCISYLYPKINTYLTSDISKDEIWLKSISFPDLSSDDSSKNYPHHGPSRQVAQMCKRTLKNAPLLPAYTHTPRKYLLSIWGEAGALKIQQ